MNRAAQLAELLAEANLDPWESVHSAVQALSEPHTPRACWLLEHLRDTKRAYWTEVLGAPAPDLPLAELLHWEVQAALALTPEQLDRPVDYAGRAFTVESLLRFSARHAVWHAGQLRLARL